MPKRLEYTTEFKEQAVRFVFESIEPTESRKQACERVAVKVKPVTLYNWVKAATPASAKGPGRPAHQGRWRSSGRRWRDSGRRTVSSPAPTAS